MDFFSTALFAAILGLGMSVLTEMAKIFNLPPKAFLLGFSVGIAMVVTMFDTFVPAAIRENVIMFVQAALGTAVIIYDFLVKPLKEHMDNVREEPPKNFDV